MNESNRQLIHRAYLRSPLWQAKRLEALNYYGPTCARCGKPGSDVHHRTYARTGGGELMRDLEILCRPCHEAHHRVERATKKGKKRRAARGINSTALARYLTPAHREFLQQKFGHTWGVIYLAIIEGEEEVTREALRLLGKEYAYLPKRTYTKKQAFNGFQMKHVARLMS